MYKKGDKVLSVAEATSAAKAIGFEVNEWASKFGWQLSEEGKTNGSTETTPPIGPEQIDTAAGDSSSADISLESLQFKPYFLTEEDLEGDEIDVVNKVQQKLNAIGLDVEDDYFLRDGIKITKPEKETTIMAGGFYPITKVSNNVKSLIEDDNKTEALTKFNNFIAQYGDLSIADSLKEDEENKKIVQDYKEVISNTNVTDEEAKSAVIVEKRNQRIEEIQKEQGSQGIVNPLAVDFDFIEVSEKETEAKKQQIFDEEVNAAGEKFIRNLPKEKQDVVKTVLAKEVIDLNVRAENLLQEREEIELASNDINDRIEKFNADPNRNEEQLRLLQSDILELQQEQSSYNDFITSVQDPKTENLLYAANIATKNYNLLEKTGTNFANTFIDLGYGAARMMVQFSRFGGQSAKKVMDVKYAPVAERGEKKLAQFATGAKFGEFKDLEDVASWSTNTVSQALPSLSLAFTGTAAMPLFFLSGYGSKASQLSLETFKAAERKDKNEKLLQEGSLSPEEIENISKQIEEDNKILNRSEVTKEISALSAGGAETVFEGLGTLSILKGLGRVGNVLKPKIAANFVKAANREGLTEAGTQIVNNTSDILFLDKDVNPFEGVGETYAGGALIGGPLSLKKSAPLAYEYMVSGLANRQQAKDLKDKLSQLEKLTGFKDINNELDPNIPRKEQAPEVEALITEINNDIINIKEDIANRVGTDLTSKDVYEVFEVVRKQKSVNDQYISLIEKFENGKINVVEFNEAKNILKNKFDSLDEQRQELLRSENNNVDRINFNAKAGYEAILGRQYANQKTKSLREFEKLDVVTKNNYLEKANGDKAQARENYFEERNADIIAKDKEASKKLLDGLGIKATLTPLDDASYKKRIEELNKDIDRENAKTGQNLDKFDPKAEAFITPDNELIVNTTLAAKEGRIGVWSHEALHAITKDALKTQGKANQAGKDLLGWLENNAPETFTYVNTRLEALYEGSSAYYEEALNALSDYIAEGNDVDLNSLNKIRLFVNNILGRQDSKLSIDTPLQTFSFIAKYANKNKTQDVDKIIRAYAKGIEGEEEKMQTKESISFAADKAKQRLESIQKEGPIQPYDSRVLEELPGMINAQAQPYINKGLQLDRQELQSEVQLRLFEANDIAKFDGRGSFYGYLNGRIKFRILDAFKNNKDIVDDFGDVDIQDLTGKEARQIAVEETTDAPVADIPTYKNLIDRKVVSEGALSNINKKVLSTVRVLKNRLDEAVSKNRTVTPLIAEIKKAVGKQADIDLKKEMGGIKDAKFRRYLLKNKRAILENMTTTYLMTAMPNAIQKKVDGTFTSNWKGKKIDRETVDTDAAGRTSGAEITRRLPNASTRLSDADFLSNFLNEDGSLIRGRKESLAKAMAEEIGFDIINQELQNPESEIRKALEQNQERQGVALFDNYVNEFKRQAERGNVKYSISIDYVQAASRLYRLAQKEGIDNTIDSNGNILINPEEYNGFEDIGYVVRTAFDEGLVTEQPVLQFLRAVKANKNISEDLKVKVAKALTRKRSSKAELDAYEKDAAKIVKILGKDITDILGFDMFGYINRVLDPAASKKDVITKQNIPGARGAYFNKLETLKNSIKQSKDLPSNLDLTKVSPMNSNIGVMGKIARILNSNDTAAKKKEKYKKFIPEIEAANVHNKILAKHVIKKLVNAVQNNDISQESFINFLQLQTNVVKGLRSLTGLKYITFKDGPQGNIKGEHLADNGGTMLEIVDLGFANLNDIQLDTKIDEMLEYHDQWLENKTTLDLVDVFGRNNPFKDLRIRLLSKADQANVFTYDLKPADELIDARSEAIRKKIEFDNQFDGELAQKAIEEYKQPFESRDVKYSQGLSKEFNNIIERTTGVEAFKEFSRIQAQMRGAKKGKYKYFIAPSADDFRGLVNYAFSGKGKQGEADMKFLEETLMRPYMRGIAAINSARQQIKTDFKTTVKTFKEEYRLLNQTIGDSTFNYDHAVRLYLWEKQGTEVQGLSKRDRDLLRKAIVDNPGLAKFADALMMIPKQETWAEPGSYWEGGTVLSDLNSMTEKVNRQKYIAEFIENADAVFTEANLNKVEAIYGTSHRQAIEDALYAMKNGTNRPTGNNAQVNKWLNWINNSTGAIMFFNRRSALLQMLSFTNFINLKDNNVLKAAQAFANQKQFWSDFTMIYNSDKLKERRGGLKQDVNASEIANIAKESKNNPQAILRKLLKLGFLPNQAADSMAISLGGASFYRNRVNTYLKEGMNKKDAEGKAFEDFSKLSDEAQQSADPALVSQVQRSVLGRLIFAFQNTPMQYTRLMKKAGQDLINRRGDYKEHIGKILYYGAIQNFIFSALQSALFTMIPGFDDEEELTEKEIANNEKKIIRILNGMGDTVLRGSGVYGAIASTVKNIIMEYSKQEEKGWIADHTYTILAAAGISPPISSKLRKLYNAVQTKKFNKDEIEARGWAITNEKGLNLGPNYEIVGSLVESTLNVPLARTIDEVNSITEALDSRNTAFQRIALALGWRTWDVGAIDEEAEEIKDRAKEARSKAKKSAKEKTSGRRTVKRKTVKRETVRRK